jgi:outer membrane protein assembly factor BamB
MMWCDFRTDKSGRKTAYAALYAGAFLALSDALGTNAAYAQDFPQWRGAKRDGVVTGFVAPSAWPEKLEQGWRITVGEGHSSPIVAGDSVYIFAREGDNEIMRRLRLSDGKEIWRDSYLAPYVMNPAASGHGKGPKATPVLSAGHVFTFGISGILTGYDASSGKILWRKTFAPPYKTSAPDFGTTSSPLVEKNLVIAHVGGTEDGALTAFDVKTGAERWKWSGDSPAYASPIAVTLDGVRQIITQTKANCVSLDAATGKLLWKMPFTTPYDQNSITPVVSGPLVIFGGLQKPTFAIKPTRDGANWKIENVWEARDVPLYMSSPVLNGLLYGMSAKRSGQMFSLDPATGKVLWTDEGRVGDNASLWSAGSNILALTTNSDLFVYQKAGNTLKPVAKYAVAETPVWASPAIVRNGFLVKDEKNLTLWQIPVRSVSR